MNAVLTYNRRATPEEFEYAEMYLHTLGAPEIASVAKLHKTLPSDAGEPDFYPVVVHDFAEITEEQILLIPPGVHEVPVNLFQNRHLCVIGLRGTAGEKPVLLFNNSEVTRVFNPETCTSTEILSCELHGSRFAWLTFSARQETVLEICALQQAFSDRLMQVDYGPSIEVVNPVELVLMHGRPWAVSAYGSTYRVRSNIESTFDAVHEKTMAGIDAVFSRLISAADKVERMFDTR